LTSAALPQRRCLVCRRTAAKDTMLRLVCDDEGRIWPDPLARAGGRGAYLCMRPRCIRALRDKQLAAAWRRSEPRLPQRDALLRRVEVALATLCRQYLARLRPGAAIGHAALRRRLAEDGALVVVLAADAGGALRRDVLTRVERRGRETHVCIFPDGMEMGRALGRPRVAVAAVALNGMARRMMRFCAWHAQLKESR